jgi:hypothetical protein
MQGKLSANHGCQPPVGTRAGTEPAPTPRPHGRHGGRDRPRASPAGGRRSRPGRAALAAWGGSGFGYRFAGGCDRLSHPDGRPRGAPPALARRSSETRYIGGSP